MAKMVYKNLGPITANTIMNLTNKHVLILNLETSRGVIKERTNLSNVKFFFEDKGIFVQVALRMKKRLIDGSYGEMVEKKKNVSNKRARAEENRLASITRKGKKQRDNGGKKKGRK